MHGITSACARDQRLRSRRQSPGRWPLAIHLGPGEPANVDDFGCRCLDAGKKKLEFEYDHQGRRIQKKVYTRSSGTSTYELHATTRFVYDDWNLITEVDGSSSC